MLNAKNEQCKKLEETIKSLNDKVEEYETTIDSQKTAYEVLLSTLSDFEENTKDLKAQLETKDERIEELIKEEKKPGHVSRNSMGSDGDDYSSVQEMRENLK